MDNRSDARGGGGGGRGENDRGHPHVIRRPRLSQEMRRSVTPYGGGGGNLHRRRYNDEDYVNNERGYNNSNRRPQPPLRRPSSSSSSRSEGSRYGGVESHPDYEEEDDDGEPGTSTSRRTVTGFWGYLRTALGGDRGGDNESDEETVAGTTSRIDRDNVRVRRGGTGTRSVRRPFRESTPHNDDADDVGEDDDTNYFQSSLFYSDRRDSSEEMDTHDPFYRNDIEETNIYVSSSTSSSSSSSSSSDDEEEDVDHDDSNYSDPDEQYDDDWAVRVGRRYTIPRGLDDENDDASGIDPAVYQTQPPQDVTPRMLPSLEGRILLGDLLDRIPWTNMLRGLREGEVNFEESLFKDKRTFYGDILSWSSNKRELVYPSGIMYVSSTPISFGIWQRTLRQAYVTSALLTSCNSSDSFVASKIHHSTVVEFLLDAVIRIACRCHFRSKKLVARAGSDVVRRDDKKGKGKENARSRRVRGSSSISHASTSEEGASSSSNEYGYKTLLRPISDRAAGLFLELGLIGTARGAVASLLRSSYGSLAYNPYLREAIEAPGRRHIRFTLIKIQDADVVLFARTKPNISELTGGERKVLSNCLTLGTAAAELCIQFLYAAIGRRLHPMAKDQEYSTVMAMRPSMFLPMANETLADMESAIAESMGESITGGSSAVGSCEMMAYYAFRSSMTELISEFAEAQNNENGEIAVSIIVASAVILQRFMGHLNSVVNVLAQASLYCGQKVTIYSNTLVRYAEVVSLCAPLYARVSLDDYWKEREEALYRLALTPVSGEPPSGKNAVKAINPSPDLQHFPRNVSGTEFEAVLGGPIQFETAVNAAREVILGDKVMTAAMDYVKGRRGLGKVRRR